MSSILNESKDQFKIRIPDGPPRETRVDRVWKTFVAGLLIFFALLVGGFSFDFPILEVARSSHSSIEILIGLLVAGALWWSTLLSGDMVVFPREQVKKGWRRLSLRFVGVLLLTLCFWGAHVLIKWFCD